MKEAKPIDKTKKSNRRCCNCEHYPQDTTCYDEVQCLANVRKVNYWNCCYQFEWSSRKKYKDMEERKNDEADI